MQRILINQFPFLLIDESQDTNKQLIDALLSVESAHRQEFCIGFIGDTMQRIYSDGKEKIEEELPPVWAKPAKKLNHRCPKRIVRLINKIRSEVDRQQQEARTDKEEGHVRVFILPIDTADKISQEDAARKLMAKAASDEAWLDREQCKILTLEHHMAARRMGFSGVFDPLYEVEDFRTGLLDGSLSMMRVFTDRVLPLVKAEQDKDKFTAAKIVREFSPILSVDSIKAAPDQRKQLQKAKIAVQSLMSLWKNGEPTCGAVLENVEQSGLFSIPDGLKPLLAIQQDETNEADDTKDEVSEQVAALEKMLHASFSEILHYARYVADDAPFDTHQGVKGLEFDRVMVVMDDSEARGFLFGYEKLLGAQDKTTADLKNQNDGKETTIDRTRRLFYVTCSRAKKSLGLVIYSAKPTAVKDYLTKNGWFDEAEIILKL